MEISGQARATKSLRNYGFGYGVMIHGLDGWNDDKIIVKLFALYIDLNAIRLRTDESYLPQTHSHTPHPTPHATITWTKSIEGE